MDYTHKPRSRNIRQSFKNIGIDLPASYSAALAAIESRYDAAQADLATSDPTTQHAELAAAVDSALTAGRNLTTDKTITAIAMKRIVNDTLHLGAYVAELEANAYRDALEDHAEDLLDALQEPFNDAAAAIETAREKISPTVDLTSAGVINIAPAHSDIWSAAYTATVTIGLIVKAWKIIARSCRLVTEGNKAMMPLMTADMDVDVWLNLHRKWPLWPELGIADIDGRAMDEMLPIYRGLPLSLASPTEYDRRCRAIRDGQAQIQERSLAAGRKMTGLQRVAR